MNQNIKKMSWEDMNCRCIDKFKNTEGQLKVSHLRADVDYVKLVIAVTPILQWDYIGLKYIYKQ